MLAAASGAFAVATLGAAPPPADERGAIDAVTKRVYVMDNFFDPRSISTRRGGRMVWVWRGDNSHNVTFTKVPRGATRKGASTRRDGRYARTFRRRGLYRYVCTIHAGMRGSIDVDYEPLPSP